MISDDPMFTCGELQLEGVWHMPEGEGRFPAVVVCHPHPLFGGGMSSNVVIRVCQYLEERGIAAFRFNFRGVGRSQGYHDNGKAERLDVAAALDFVSADDRVDPDRLGLAGYSFGAGVALYVALKDERVRALALISPWLKLEEAALAERWRHPRLLIWGSEDEYAPPEAVSGKTRSDYVIVPGADHLWGGSEDVMAEAVATLFVTAFAGE
ncbi:MAG: alpha/beta fold hydrolase [Dehalococcoidia bacterium]|nr:alpha/beta fold hydrolase [Dehalococcoidia bacterium]